RAWRTMPGVAPSSGAGERATRRGGGAEPAARDREHRLLGLLAQSDPVEQVAAREPVERRHGVPDRVARLAACDAVLPAVPASGTEVLEEQHADNVTPSYILRPPNPRVLPVTAQQGAGFRWVPRIHRMSLEPSAPEHAPFGPLPEGGSLRP